MRNTSTKLSVLLVERSLQLDCSWLNSSSFSLCIGSVLHFWVLAFFFRYRYYAPGVSFTGRAVPYQRHRPADRPAPRDWGHTRRPPFTNRSGSSPHPEPQDVSPVCCAAFSPISVDRSPSPGSASRIRRVRRAGPPTATRSQSEPVV